jgi:hypothetical protein
MRGMDRSQSCCSASRPLAVTGAMRQREGLEWKKSRSGLCGWLLIDALRCVGGSGLEIRHGLVNG